MKVADLQQHLADLRRLLESSGARGAVLADLEAIGTGLQPFRERSLREFADFLIRAERYSRGEVPIPAPKKSSKTAPRTPKATAKLPSPDPTALAQEARRLWEQVTTSEITEQMIQAFSGQLKKLTKDGLVTVAAAIDMKVAGNKNKNAIIADIERRILDRKGVNQRAGLLDRPVAPPSPPNSTPEKGVEIPPTTTVSP